MFYKKIIKEICKEENICCELISKDWVFVLTKEGVTKYIIGYNFPLNDQALGKIIGDKYAFYELCILYNLPIIKHHIIFNPNNKMGKNSTKIAHELFLKYDKNIVLKPNLGQEGVDVYHIQNEDDLSKTLQILFLRDNYSISLCPFYDIESEYRVIVLDNQVEFMFEKVRPLVVGDGIHTIKELLMKLNPKYFEFLNISNGEKILEKDEQYLYDWRFNLSRGAFAREIEDQNLKQELEQLAVQVTKKIGCGFVSVDIIKCQNKLYLMEVNSGVCIDKVCNFIDQDYHKAKEIYRKSILKMFE